MVHPHRVQQSRSVQIDATVCGLAWRLAFSCFSPPHAACCDQLLRCRSCPRMPAGASGGFRRMLRFGRLQAGRATSSLWGRFPEQIRADDPTTLSFPVSTLRTGSAPCFERHARICTRERCGADRALAPGCSSFSRSPLGTRLQTFRHYQERHRQRSLLADFRPGCFPGGAVCATPGRRFAPASPAKPQHFFRRRRLRGDGILAFRTLMARSKPRRLC